MSSNYRQAELFEAKLLKMNGKICKLLYMILFKCTEILVSIPLLWSLNTCVSISSNILLTCTMPQTPSTIYTSQKARSSPKQRNFTILQWKCCERKESQLFFAVPPLTFSSSTPTNIYMQNWPHGEFILCTLALQCPAAKAFGYRQNVSCAHLTWTTLTPQLCVRH